MMKAPSEVIEVSSGVLSVGVCVIIISTVTRDFFGERFLNTAVYSKN